MKYKKDSRPALLARDVANTVVNAVKASGVIMRWHNDEIAPRKKEVVVWIPPSKSAVNSGLSQGVVVPVSVPLAATGERLDWLLPSGAVPLRAFMGGWATPADNFERIPCANPSDAKWVENPEGLSYRASEGYSLACDTGEFHDTGMGVVEEARRALAHLHARNWPMFTLGKNRTPLSPAQAESICAQISDVVESACAKLALFGCEDLGDILNDDIPTVAEAVATAEAHGEFVSGTEHGSAGARSEGVRGVRR